MAPIVLEGDTLGQRHRYYNKLVKDAIGLPQNTEKINYEENDINNLIKIEIANKNRNVDFILEVLKCEDMLYVSRAMKRCTWLITDPQYMYIINPEFLHSKLLPEMMAKASNKLLLKIRLELKDENRVNEFFEYFRLKNLSYAFKWLPNCSLSVIEQAVLNHGNDMKPLLLKRLCEKSITVLELFIRNSSNYKKDYMDTTKFLMKQDLNKYLDIVETVSNYEFPNFGIKGTQNIMKNCKERVLNNFEKYIKGIDLKTFANYINTDDINSFLLKWAKNENIRYFISFETLSYFIKRIPEENRFQYIKKIFIDKEYLNKNDREYEDATSIALLSGLVQCDIHCWYRFAPFEVALTDLKKIIRTESIHHIRSGILEELITCANGNLKHIHELLQYYHDKHINEPFHVKSQFINKIILNTNIHKYEDKTWNILNSVFHSMEVYSESNKNVQTCIEAIIIYKILHKDEVPVAIKNKFVYTTLKAWQKKLTLEEQELVFNYLYNLIKEEIHRTEESDDTSDNWINEIARLLNQVLMLLNDWKKDLTQYPWVLQAINKVSEIKQRNESSVDISSLYHAKKTWRKHMFESSFMLHLSDGVCTNALKHNPDLLTRYQKELHAICIDDSVSLKRFLRKLRIYWPHNLAENIKANYINHLTQNRGHKAIIRGLFTLMTQSELQSIVKKYAPESNKVNWNEDDELVHSVRKQISKNLYVARPLPLPDTVLLYAKGDYLQYALPSLNSIFFNISSAAIRKSITSLLNAPVSLQKHGIQLANVKLKTNELIPIFENIWKSSRNASIRAVLFKLTFQLLQKEKEEAKVQEIWQLLSTFMDGLTSEENKIIHHTLAKVKEVPYSVRGQFCMKSYLYLKSLPPKTKCEVFLRRVIESMSDIMELLQPAFVEKIISEFIDNIFLKHSIEYLETHFLHVMSTFILCIRRKECEQERVDFFLKILTERILQSWDLLHDGKYCVRNNLKVLFEHISGHFHTYVVRKRMINPVELFDRVLETLETSLNLQENYKLLTNWKIVSAFVRLLDKNKAVLLNIEVEDISILNSDFNYDRWKEFYIAAAPEFAKIIIKNLKGDLIIYGSTICSIFYDVLDDFFYKFNIYDLIKYDVCKLMLENDDTLEVWLIVLKMLPSYVNGRHSSAVMSLKKCILSHSSEVLKIHFYNKYEDPFEKED